MDNLLNLLSRKHYENADSSIDLFSKQEHLRRERITDAYLANLAAVGTDIEQAVGEMICETQESAYKSGMLTGAQLIFELLMREVAQI